MLQELRLHPGKLTEEFQEQEQETKTSQETRHGWGEWEEYQKTLGELLEKHIHSAKRRRWQKNRTGH